MQYVVCYDIADDDRRTRLAKALLDFGTRIQESVFVANLDDTLYVRMIERIKRNVEQNFDRVHVFHLCAGCEGKTETFGTAEVVEDPEFYII